MKRTPMKRTKPLRATPTEARASVPVFKPRKCKAIGCGAKFVPARPMQAACSTPCAIILGALAKAKKVKDEAKQERAADRKKREAMKTHPQLVREAQTAFNAWIRQRDAGLACICCGRQPGSASLTGGDFDAGHYRSVGSAPHLRFDERNVHAQLKLCNRFGAGRAVDYRIGLISRIGQAAVEALEADQTPRKYSRDELRAIRDDYRARVRAMKKEQA